MNLTISELKHQLKQHVQVNNLYPRDCRNLVVEIERTTGRNISETTLRRFFGLLPTKSEPSKYTIETLTIFLEKCRSPSSFESIISGSRDKIKIESKKRIEESGGLNERLISSLGSSDLVTNDLNQYLLFFIEQAIRENNYDFIISLYDGLPYSMDNSLVYTYLGRHLSKSVISKDNLVKLSRSKNVRLYFFERYVDMAHFKNFKKYLESYLKSENAQIKILWANALVLWGNYLSCQKVDWQTIAPDEIIKDYFNLECHPLIRARVLGALLFNDKIDRDRLTEYINWEIENERRELHRNPYSVPLFSSMIVHYLLFMRKREMLEKILTVYEKHEVNKGFSISQGIPFEIKLLKNLLGISNYTFDLIDITSFQSGFTGENYMIQTLACHYVSSSSNLIEVDKFKSQIITQSGFTRLRDFRF